MAKAEQIKALIRSHAAGDNERFYAMVLQVAAHADASGHGTFAQEVRGLMNAKDRGRPRRNGAPPHPSPYFGLGAGRAQGPLTGLLAESHPSTRFADMALPAELAERLAAVAREQHQRDLLRSHGFSPARKVLLAGPPGTGKTMTSAALAGELNLPHFTILLDGLITKLMGETAAKLRLVFDAMEATRGVYLFDEFDALGAQRGMGQDVGEIRRVLNSFLLFLEQDNSDSLIVCATNHAGLLDEALFRRFDAVLEYPLPPGGVRMAVMQSRLALLDTSTIDWAAAAKASAGLSHAEVTSAAEQAAKHAILSGTTTVTTPVLVSTLQERQAARR